MYKKKHFCAVWREAEKSKNLVGRIRVNKRKSTSLFISVHLSPLNKEHKPLCSVQWMKRLPPILVNTTTTVKLRNPTNWLWMLIWLEDCGMLR